MRKEKVSVVRWCEECGERFESKQPKAKFHSELCRKRFWRKRAIVSGKIKLKGGKRGRPKENKNV